MLPSDFFSFLTVRCVEIGKSIVGCAKRDIIKKVEKDIHQNSSLMVYHLVSY